MTTLPPLALSVRQPWAWAIIHGGKDIENRTPFAIGKGQLARAVGTRIAVHAAKHMTRDEYEAAVAFMGRLGVTCPPPWALARGGLVGSVRVTGTVTARSRCLSPWWQGGSGLVLADPEPCELVPAAGQLGLFAWRPGDPSGLPALARWMLPPAPSAAAQPRAQSWSKRWRRICAATAPTGTTDGAIETTIACGCTWSSSDTRRTSARHPTCCRQRSRVACLSTLAPSLSFPSTLIERKAPMRDRTAMTEPLTIGQQIVAKWESLGGNWSEPADVAEAIAAALAAEREACAKLLERDAAIERDVAKRLEASAYYDDLRQAEKHELAASSLDEAAAAIRARSTPDAKEHR